MHGLVEFKFLPCWYCHADGHCMDQVQYHISDGNGLDLHWDWDLDRSRVRWFALFLNTGHVPQTTSILPVILPDMATNVMCMCHRGIVRGQ